MPDQAVTEASIGVPDEVSCDAARLERAAWAFTTRRVRGIVSGIASRGRTPKAGDLVLARVDEIGFHSALQLPDGRRRRFFQGDEIVVVYGNRYAPNQFEAVVPKTLRPCQLVASGGVAGKVLSWHSSLSKLATQIMPLALLAGLDGRPANLRDFAIPSTEHVSTPPPILAVVGTSMDSGKTQTAAFLVRGLVLAGLRVGFAKITGTGSGGDTWLLKDAGAHPVVDFTDAGLSSTYLASPAEVLRVFVTLTAHLSQSHVDVIVLEIADGLLQGETAALLKTEVFRELVGGILFTASDALGACAGDTWLRSNGLPLIALSGVLTASPLAAKEASKATGLATLSRQQLARPETALQILGAAERRSPKTPASTSARLNETVALRMAGDEADR